MQYFVDSRHIPLYNVVIEGAKARTRMAVHGSLELECFRAKPQTCHPDGNHFPDPE